MNTTDQQETTALTDRIQVQANALGIGMRWLPTTPDNHHVVAFDSEYDMRQLFVILDRRHDWTTDESWTEAWKRWRPTNSLRARIAWTWSHGTEVDIRVPVADLAQAVRYLDQEVEAAALAAKQGAGRLQLALGWTVFAVLAVLLVALTITMTHTGLTWFMPTLMLIGMFYAHDYLTAVEDVRSARRRIALDRQPR